MPASYQSNKKYLMLLLLMALAGLLIHVGFWMNSPDSLRGQDIYHVWLEGRRITLGENPYARVLAGDMRINDKYATYFPLSYLLSALMQIIGFSDFKAWLYVWRPISFAFHIGIISLIFRYFSRRNLWIFGFVYSTIILSGRWSIYVVRVHHLEFAAIFFLLLSLVLWKEKKITSLMMFSFSLGIKHIAIFLLPIYLIDIWKNSDKSNQVKGIFWGFLIILSIPMLTSLPFLVWNAEGFLKSILFSATRVPSLHIQGASSIDMVLSARLPWLTGIIAKLPMLILMMATYLSFMKEKINMFATSAVAMMIFLYFNSVLFLQYFLWPLCLIPFALIESMTLSSRRIYRR